MEKVNSKKKGQISLEYLLLIGGLFVIVIILFVIFSNFIVTTGSGVKPEGINNFVHSSLDNNKIIYDINPGACIQRPKTTGLNYTFKYNGDSSVLSFVAYNLGLKDLNNNFTINCILTNSSGTSLSLKKTELNVYNSLFETTSLVSFNSVGSNSFSIDCWNEKSDGTKVKSCDAVDSLGLNVLTSFPYYYSAMNSWPKYRLDFNGNPGVSTNSSTDLGLLWDTLIFKKNLLNVSRSSGSDTNNYTVSLLWTCKPHQQLELVYSNLSSKGVVYSSCYADLAYSLNDSNNTYSINTTSWNVSGTSINFGSYLDSLLPNSLLVASLDSYNGSVNWVNNYFGFSNVSDSATVFGKTENYSYVKGQLSPLVYKDYLILFGLNKNLINTNGGFGGPGVTGSSSNAFRSNYTRLMLVNKTTGVSSCAVNYSRNEFASSSDSLASYAIVNSNLFVDTSNDSIQLQGLGTIRSLVGQPWNVSVRNWGTNFVCNQRMSGNQKGSQAYPLYYSTSPLGTLNTTTYWYDGMDSGGIMDYSRSVAYFFNNDCRTIAYYPYNQTQVWTTGISVLENVYNSTNNKIFYNLTSCGQFVSEPVLWNNTLLIGTSFQRPTQENKTIFDGYKLDLNTTKLVAVNVSSKSLQWFYPNYTFTNSSGYTFSNYGSVNSRSSPLVYDNSLVIIKVANHYNSSGVADKNNSIVALYLANGTEAWTFDLNSNTELIDYNWDSTNVNRPLGVIIENKVYLRELDYGDSSLSSSDKKKRPVIVLWAVNGSRASNYVLVKNAPLSLWNSLISASNFFYYPTGVVSNDSTYHSYTRNTDGVNYTSIQSLFGNTTSKGGQDGSDVSFIIATLTNNSGSQPSLIKIGVDVNESIAYNYSFFVTDSWYSTNYTSCNVTVDNGNTQTIYPATKYDNYAEGSLFQINNLKLPSLSNFYTFTVKCSDYLGWNTTRTQKIYSYPYNLN